MFEVCGRSQERVKLSGTKRSRCRSKVISRYWGVFWIDCGSEITASTSFERIGRLCGLRAPDTSSVQDWLSSTTKRWLLIIDNADNPERDYARYFPSGIYGDIIVTTRNPELRKYATVGSESLDQLDTFLARKLLLQAIGLPQPAQPEDIKTATDIVEDLGRHTLALIHAGAFIADSCRPDEYLGLYHKQRDRLFNFECSIERSTYGTVHTTFEVSARRLEELRDSGSVEAADALELLSLFAFTHYAGQYELILTNATERAAELELEQYRATSAGRTSWTIIHCNESLRFSAAHATWLPPCSPQFGQGAEGKLRWRRACKLLASFSLITNQSAGNTDLNVLVFHPLIHQWMKERQTVDSRARAWFSAAVVLSLASEVKNSDWTAFKTLKPHIRSCLSHDIHCHLEGYKADLAFPVLYKLVSIQFLGRDKLIDDSRTEGILELLENLLDKDAGRIDTTARLERTTEDRTGRLLGEGSPQGIHQSPSNDSHFSKTSAALEVKNLRASWFRASGRYQDAIKELKYILEVQTKSLKETDPGLHRAQCSLASAYLQQGGSDEEAIRLFKHVLEVLPSSAKLSDFRLRIDFNLALAYYTNGQIKRSFFLLKSVTNKWNHFLDKAHPQLLNAQALLARVHMANGQIKEAIQLLEHVAHIRKAELGESSPDLISTQTLLSEAYYIDGRLEKALMVQQNVVRVEKPRSKAPHESYIRSLGNLFMIYMALQRVRDGRIVLEEIQKLRG